MKTYMATYRKQNFRSDGWKDDTQTQNTLYIFAEDDEKAKENLDVALWKLNQYAGENVKYKKVTEPKEIVAMSVSYNLACGTTSVNGIWE